MRPLDIVRVALFDLRAARLRSLLTALGVIIGVASVTLLLSLGEGVRTEVTGTFADLGTTRIIVTPASTAVGPGASTLTLADAAAIRALPGVESVSAGLALAGEASAGSRPAVRVATIGVESEYFRVSGDEFRAGGAFGRGQAVLDESGVRTIFGSTVSAAQAIGQTFRLGSLDLAVSGVVADPPTANGRGGGGGGGGGSDFATASGGTVYLAIAPLMAETHQSFVSQIQLRSTDPNDVDSVRVAVRDTLQRRHGVLDVSVISLARLLERVTQALSVITGFLAALAGISLLVGGIGIMNIMLAVVAERTREIGIIRAFGASRRAVVAQFLAEATVISLLGGLLGLSLAWVGTVIAERALGVPAAPSAGIVALALGVSTLIGILFGVLPAYRAARLDPISALRHD